MAATLAFLLVALFATAPSKPPKPARPARRHKTTEEDIAVAFMLLAILIGAGMLVVGYFSGLDDGWIDTGSGDWWEDDFWESGGFTDAETWGGWHEDTYFWSGDDRTSGAENWGGPPPVIPEIDRPHNVPDPEPWWD